jgi:hypothetical protein
MSGEHCSDRATERLAGRCNDRHAKEKEEASGREKKLLALVAWVKGRDRGYAERALGEGPIGCLWGRIIAHNVPRNRPSRPDRRKYLRGLMFRAG